MKKLYREELCEALESLAQDEIRAFWEVDKEDALRESLEEYLESLDKLIAAGRYDEVDFDAYGEAYKSLNGVFWTPRRG